jgi:hypothetical protein
MINNIWLQKFKKKYMYDEIKQILLSNKNSINYEKIISEFLYNLFIILTIDRNILSEK